MIRNKYIKENEKRFLDELFEIIRIPSIGGDKNFQKETKEAAQYLCQKLREAGAEKVSFLKTKGQPIIYAEKIINPSLPTILVYGHYDVQPTGPLSAWTSPPFEPTIRNESIYARGACDDKGQLYAHVKAFETLVATNQLPCNVKFLIEGEEEVGSPSMTPLLEDLQNIEQLKCDLILVSDTSMPTMDQPIVLMGLRGITMLEITIKGPKRDLHSGLYGGAVQNPIHALSTLIDALHDENHTITIPGFYDDVLTLSASDRKVLDYPFFDEKSYKKELGLDELIGEKGYSTTERLGIRPALDVNGIWSGTIGVKKTVLPSQAHALLSIRFVPHQDPEKIITDFKAYIKHLHKSLPALAGTTITCTPSITSKPLMLSPDAPAVKMLKTAYAESWGGKVAALRYEGGSIPVLSELNHKLKSDIALLGFGLDNDNIHAPDEKFGVENYFRGIETIISFFHTFAQF